MKTIHAVTLRGLLDATKALPILVAFLIFGAVAAAVGQTETVLYTFAGGNDGENPLYGLIADASGSLYGTTYNGGNTPCGGGCGTVFQLTPSGNSWTETVLYRFTGGVNDDGQYPNSDLLMDAKGALYGTTYEGGKTGWGDVFKLTPPLTKGGAWTETILHDFTGHPDGGGPYGSLVMDKHGALYGTTRYQGTNYGGMVYKLTPRGNSWTEKVLYNFTYQGTTDGTSPLAGLIFDKNGALYGTTLGGGTSTGCSGGPCGTVFKLTPPQTKGGAWTESILYSFKGA